MEIALMADDKKKELMIQFCIAYAGILNKHNLCATGATARLISEATGLSIEPYLGGIQGGGEQVIARISCDEIDLVIYFRDSQAESNNELDFSKLCDTRNIPYATNLATAEVLILALQRGGLDWRYNIKSGR